MQQQLTALKPESLESMTNGVPQIQDLAKPLFVRIGSHHLLFHFYRLGYQAL